VDSVTNTWFLNNIKIDPLKIYRVTLTDFLTGGEANLGYLNRNNPEIVKVYDAETAVSNPLSHIRTATMQYLRRL